MNDFQAKLYNPFPHRVSPYIAELREKADQWINEAYAGLPQSFHHMLKQLNPGDWAAHCWPDAPLPVLIPITRSLLWGISFDDYYAPFDINDLEKAGARMLAIAGGEKPLPDENSILHQTYILIREFEQIAPAYWVQRYVYCLSLLLEGMKIDSAVSYRKDVKYPSLKDYPPIRRKSMGAGGISGVVELATGLLPDFIFVHPFVQEARMLAEDLMGWGNDLASAEKELADQEALNLVLVIRHERNCSLDTAFAEAVNMYNDHVAAYERLCHNVPDFGVYTPLVQKYLEGLGVWISGQLHWFDRTARYASHCQTLPV